MEEVSFLFDNQLIAGLEKLIKDAKSKLVLISPFIDLDCKSRKPWPHLAGNSIKNVSGMITTIYSRPEVVNVLRRKVVNLSGVCRVGGSKYYLAGEKK